MYILSCKASYLLSVIFGLHFFGPSPNVKKALFFPISWGKIPNSVVIKLFVKIINEIFFK